MWRFIIMIEDQWVGDNNLLVDDQRLAHGWYHREDVLRVADEWVNKGRIPIILLVD